MSVEKIMVDCGVALTIAHASELHEKLTSSLEQTSTIELQVESIEKVDTAGLQILVSLEAEIKKNGGEVIWLNPSVILKESIVTLGLSHSIHL